MIRVYRNLNKQCFSVQRKDSNGRWKVVEHIKSILLKGVEFKVNLSGQKRVIREQSKNVHAFVIGEPTGLDFVRIGRKISYNPYKGPNFFYVDNEKPVNGVSMVYADYPYLFEVLK